jgi:hypothetical protein
MEIISLNTTLSCRRLDKCPTACEKAKQPLCMAPSNVARRQPICSKLDSIGHQFVPILTAQPPIQFAVKLRRISSMLIDKYLGPCVYVRMRASCNATLIQQHAHERNERDMQFNTYSNVPMLWPQYSLGFFIA